MSILERRVQLLLSEEQYARVATEASRSGQSVNAVIRDAIDLHYAGGDKERTEGLSRFLELAAAAGRGETRSWSELKDEMDAHIDAELMS